MSRSPWSRHDLHDDPLTVAKRILGAELVVERDDGHVRLRIVEVEAYGGPPDGPHPDRASHGYPGPTPRNAVMFGSAGHLYVYRSYGIHLCMNVTCGPSGTCGAVLIRAGEVVDGADLVRRRRAPVADENRWAMGPGNLGAAVGICLTDNATDLLNEDSAVRLERPTTDDGRPVSAGPRVGLTTATGRPWRLWLNDSPAVSAFRPGSAAVRRRRAARSVADQLAVAAGDAEGSDW